LSYSKRIIVLNLLILSDLKDNLMYDIALYCLKSVLFLDFRVYICKIFFYFVLEIRKIKYKKILFQVQSKTRTYVEHTAKKTLRSITKKKRANIINVIISLIIRNIFNNDNRIDYCAKSRNIRTQRLDTL